MSKTNRNYGIELLRIFSLLCVIILHILSHGQVLSTTSTTSGFAAAWLLEIFAYPAVNCFVLISGFVGYKKERVFPKLKNILSLFLTVLFYSVFICLILKIFLPNKVGMGDLIKSFFPILTNQYWFFTAYFAMFLISPMLNFFVYKADKKMLFISFLVILFFGVSVLLLDPFSLKNGYTFVWLSFVYLIGAIIKKYDLIKCLSVKLSVIFILSGLLITWLPKVIFQIINFNVLGLPLSKLGNFLVSYCSPTVLIMAIGWLCLFYKIQPKTFLTPIISFFSSSAFSVYLIHDNSLIRKNLMSGAFSFVNNFNPIVLVLIVIFSSIAIFSVCVLIDKIRLLLFNALRFNKLSEKIESFIKRIFNKTFCLLKTK